jgi:hypothetical protein
VFCLIMKIIDLRPCVGQEESYEQACVGYLCD